MKKIYLILILILLGSATFSADVDEIVKKAYNAAYYAGDDGRSTVDMEIVDKNGTGKKKTYYYASKGYSRRKGADVLCVLSKSPQM